MRHSIALAIVVAFSACRAAPLAPPSRAEEALSVATGLVDRPENLLDALGMGISVVAKNPDPLLRLPTELVVRQQYQAGLDFRRGPVGGLRLELVSSESNFPDPRRQTDVELTLRELVIESLDVFIPLPSLEGWPAHLHSDVFEHGLRKLRFPGIEDAVGVWTAGKMSDPVLWLDGQNLLRAYQYLGAGNVPHRFEYEWEPAEMRPLYRLRSLKEELRLPTEDRPRTRHYVVQYGSFEGVELPASVRLQEAGPDGKPSWQIEFRYRDFRLERAQGKSRSASFPDAERLLREAYRNIFPVRDHVGTLRFSLDAEAEIPGQTASKVGFALSYQLEFTGTPMVYEDYRVLSLGPANPPPEAARKREEIVARWMPQLMQWIFEPVRGLRTAFLKVESVEERPKFFRVSVRDQDPAGRPLELLYEFDEEGKIDRQNVRLPGGGVSLQFEWHQDGSSGELRPRAVHLEQQFSGSGTYRYDWTVSYIEQDGIFLPETVELAETLPGDKAGVKLRLRFREYSILK